jgi:hypothetical protein
VGDNGDGWVEVVVGTGVRMAMEWGARTPIQDIQKTGEGNKVRELTITANNIHGYLKEIKHASQIPEGDRKK